MSRDVVRIANGQGFWGDSLLGPVRLVEEGPLDYAQRLERVRPDLASPVLAITRLYISLRYGSEPNPGVLNQLRQHVREFSA